MTPAAAPALLHAFFARAVERWPHHIAVDVPPARLRPHRHRTTYAELDRHADAVAHALAPFVTGECIVAILLPRTSAHIYAAQLGVLKAGAAFTCFDLAFPDERLRDTVADAHPAALLTDAPGRARAIAAGVSPDHIIDVVDLLQQSAPRPLPVPAPPWLTPASLAYVIYTSGTTGKPKGVMIEHRSICNLVQSDLDTFALTADDRVVQGSSTAYDSSVEESWLAFAVGGTLVLMDDDTVRLGPDLVAWLRDEEVSVFCPPPTLLRATGCERPHDELPALKLLYVGGEALPQDVADRWAFGRSLVNGYGPTECSVTCTKAHISVGSPITIGLPVHNVQAWIVDDALAPLPDGTAGELVFGGACLARGYWQQPELTAERFPHHPTLGRIYRTGDSATREADGTLIYHGRIDTQVKLRGFRVELGAIESALTACDGVREAACTVQDDDGRQSLVAFIVPEAMVPVPSAAELQQKLTSVLPPYMVPAHIALSDALPTSIGGKLHRSSLPRISVTAASGVDVAPDDPLERTVADAMRQVLRMGAYPEATADFFTALGGDSLSAADLITRLRNDVQANVLDVRDVYEARCVRGLAARVRSRVPRAQVNGPAAEPLDLSIPVAGVTVRQTMSLLKSLLFASLALWLGAFKLLPAVVLKLGIVATVLLAPPAAIIAVLMWAPVAVALAASAKRRLIGTYQPGRVRVWGADYLSHWLVQSSAKAIPWWVLEGTQFQVMALRALGARIGERVHIHRGVVLTRGGWDLLDIGDDVTLSQDASLRIAELDHGHLVYSPITLGNGVTIGVRAGVGAGCVMEANAMLADNASLENGARVPAGECWNGLPARPAGRASEPPAVDQSHALSPVAYAMRLYLTRIVFAAVFAIPLAAVTAVLVRLTQLTRTNAVEWLLSGAFSWRVVIIVSLMLAVAMPFRLVLTALACRVLGRVPDGAFSRWSGDYVRVWLKPILVDNGSKWLYGTLFWPYWLRLAGARVGHDCEISSLIDTVPEAVTIGRKNFFADGIYIGFPRLHRGTVTIAHTTFGNSTFFGNGVIVPGGLRLPDDILLGICTVADQATMREGSAWFGHPAFELPHREIIEYDAQYTFDPTPWRYAVRLFWEFARFLVPALPVLIVCAWYALVVAWSHVALPLFLLITLPAATLICGSAFTAIVVLTKWFLLGKVQPAMHPLWSSWASRWDLMCLGWHICAGPLVSQLDGTLLLNALLRITGVNVGRLVVLGSGFAEDLPDPDMLTFEDGCTVDCLFQAHTFEDRVLKMGRIAIRAGATVGHNAVLLYGSDIGAGTRVEPHSVVLKNEHLHAGLTYAGFPTRPIS